MEAYIMSNPTTVFIPVPVSEKPTIEGFYTFLCEDSTQMLVMYKDGEWQTEYLNKYHAWLKPIELQKSTSLQILIHALKHDPEYIGRWNSSDIADMSKPYLTAELIVSAGIKELEDKVTKLEAGCHERDKEFVDLQESYENVCKTVSELQIKLGK